MKFRSAILLAFSIIIVGISAVSSAVVLTTGSTALMVMPADVVSISSFGPLTSLYSVQTSLTIQGANLKNTVSGELISNVYKEVNGTIDFSYSWRSDVFVAGSLPLKNSDPVTGLNFSDFTPATVVDAYVLSELPVYGSVSLPTAYELPNLWARNSPADIKVSFDVSKIKYGESSYTVFLRTNVKDWEQGGNTGVQDTGTGNIVTPQPAPVPEPGSFAVLGLGLVGLIVRRSKK